MSKPLQSTTLAAPGFFGLNTQESGITIASGFALEATNCIIDKFGRIGSRQGWTKVSNASGSVTGAVRAIGEHTKTDGTLITLFAANNKLWKLDGSSNPVELTASSGTPITITNDDWQIVSYNNVSVFVQQDHTMVHYDASADTYSEFTAAPGSTTPSCAAACFNRVWVADDNIVYWSRILDPKSFTGTGSGFINVREIFGEDDTVTGLTSFNNRLVIFGRRNIAIFGGAEDPTSTSFQMVDHISGVGCIARDTIASVGTDAVFLSAEGVRSLGRVIVEKSSPLTDISRNVRDDIVQFAQGESEFRIKAVYSSINAFYLLSLPATNYVYCFDMRAPLQDQSRRVTIWKGFTPSAFKVTKGNDLLVGQVGYVAKYGGYKDDTSPYRLAYFTNYFDFGSPTIEKMLKNIRLAIIGGEDQEASLKWAFDYSIDYKSNAFRLSTGSSSEYNVDEYFSDDNIDNEAEYSSGIVLDNVSLSVGGRGAVLQLGIEADINGGSLSIQKIDIFAKTGKLVI